MWKIVVGVMLVAACLQAQAFQDLLLPQARHIAGVVVDSEGKPVVEASIDHSNDRQPHQTDSDGKFELNTTAPTLVVRKPGFRSELVRTEHATDVRVTLQKLGDRLFPICSNMGRHDGIDRWRATFQFTVTAGVKASRTGHDIDYSVRSYYVDTKQGHKGIMHGSGPQWGFGMPSDREVWQSVKFDEVTFDVGGLTIIDARGQLPNGNRWRSLGMFGESASYSDMDEATAATLDRFMDGACLKAASRR